MRKRDAIVLLLICGFAVLCAGAIGMGGRMHARTLMCAANMRFIGVAIGEYAEMFDGRLPQLEYNSGMSNETQQHPFWAFRDQSSTDPTKWGKAITLGCLYKAGLVHNPGTFYCPADRRWIDSMVSYATGGPWGEKVPLLPVNDPFIYDNPDPSDRPDPSAVCLRLNVAYWPQSMNLITSPDRLAAITRTDLYEMGYPDIAYKLSDLDPSKAYVSDFGGHAISGSVAGGEESKGQNALFGDGHVVLDQPPKDTVGIVYRIRKENEETYDIVDNVMPRTNRYFFYLQP